MSDAELSDINDDEDIIRRHENDDDNDDNGVGDDNMQGNEYVNVSGDEVKNDQDDEAKRVEPPKKKKGTRKLFVLNSERLKGRKGVHTIEKLYEGFRYKGKGHEKEDLDRVMKRLEYWSFRLFPKLDFDDFLEKCEHLGHKKDLQVFLKKYRMGMISADDDMGMQNDIIEEEDDERENDPTVERTRRELLDEINNDEFQRMFDESAELQQQTQQAVENTS